MASTTRGDVAGVIESLPGEERVIVQWLRSLILDAEPRIQETISYGVPYYFRNRRICFLWPASLIPANMSPATHPRVTLGMCYGNLLSNDQGLLDAGNRNQVYVVPINSIAAANERALTEIIMEAVMVDESFRKKNKK